MSPAGEAIARSAAAGLVPEAVVRGDEVIILAVRPSIWFIPLRAVPGIAMAVVIVAGLWGYEKYTGGIPYAVAAVVFTAGFLWGGMYIAIAALRWISRLYVLTDRRLLTMQGGWKPDVFECPLVRISDVVVVHYGAERLLGTGSLAFTVEDNPYARPDWIHLRSADEIAREIRRAAISARGRE